MATTEPVSVIIADSNSVLLGIVGRFLQAHAADVVAVTASPEEALARAEILRPDVVLIDLDRASLAGLEAISRLRATMPHVGIIATTFLDIAGYREAALSAGADEFVSKSLLQTHLVPAIQRLGRHAAATTRCPTLKSPRRRSRRPEQ
jgi:NarL family two-component system response regulator LiaR